MQINTRITGSVGVISPTDKPEARAVSPAAESPAVASSDSVQISDAGRARAAGNGAVSGLDPERAAKIRDNILTGAYNSLDVVDEVAKRILNSGDL